MTLFISSLKAVALVAVLNASLSTITKAGSDTPLAVQNFKTSPQTVTVSSLSTHIEKLMSLIKGAKKPLPAWAVDIALRSFSAYRAFKNRRRIEELDKAVYKVLLEIDMLRRKLEHGEAQSAEEYRLTRELLDSYGAEIKDHEQRLAALEEDSDRVKDWIKKLPTPYKPCKRQTFHRVEGVCVTKSKSVKVDWRLEAY